MKLRCDPELNDLLQMQRVLCREHYIEHVWALRQKEHPAPPVRLPYRFQRIGNVIALTNIQTKRQMRERPRG